MKRRADKQLTQNDEGEDDEIEEEVGTGFKRADPSELQARRVKGLPKRFQPASSSPSTSAPSLDIASDPLISSIGMTATSNQQSKPVSGFGGFGQFTPNPMAFPSTTAGVFTPVSVAALTDSDGLRHGDVPPIANESDAFGVGKTTKSPGSPNWSTDEARQDFLRSSSTAQYDLSKHGLNVSLVKAIEDLVEADPYQNLMLAINPLLDIYKEHRAAIDAKYGSETSKDIKKSNAMDMDILPKSLPASSLATPAITVSPPAAPPAAPSGPIMFGGKLATFGGSSSASSSPAAPPGAPAVPTGGFTAFGAAFGSPSIIQATTHAPDLVASAPPSFPVTAATEKVNVSSTNTVEFSKTQATDMDASTSSSAGIGTSTPSDTPKPSAFADFSKPKVPSPLASQPPISGLNAAGGLFSGFSGFSAPLTSKPGAPASGFSLFAQAANSLGSSSTGFGGTLTNATSFSFGKSAKPSTGFSFGTSPLSTTPPTFGNDPKEEGSGDKPASSSLLGPSPASTAIPTRDPTPELEGEGEENEVTLHETRCKLYQAVENVTGGGLEWSDRGIGSLRLKKDSDSEKRRLLFRQDGTSRVQMNFYIYPTLQATVDKKVLSFTGLDAGKPTAFRLRCKSEEAAESFKTSLLHEVEALMAAPPGLEKSPESKDSEPPKVEELNDDLLEDGKGAEVATVAAELLDKPDIEEVKTDEGRGSEAPVRAEEEEEDEYEGYEGVPGEEGAEVEENEEDYEVDYDNGEYDYEGGEGEEGEDEDYEDGDAEGEEEDQLAEESAEPRAQPDVVELLSDDEE